MSNHPTDDRQKAQHDDKHVKGAGSQQSSGTGAAKEQHQQSGPSTQKTDVSQQQGGKGVDHKSDKPASAGHGGKDDHNKAGSAGQKS